MIFRTKCDIGFSVIVTLPNSSPLKNRPGAKRKCSGAMFRGGYVWRWMETTFLMSMLIWSWQSWLPKQAVGGHEHVWWSILNWLRERWTWTLDTDLISEYIHHTDANSHFCEYVSKLKSTYLYIHIPLIHEIVQKRKWQSSQPNPSVSRCRFWPPRSRMILIAPRV